MREAQRDREREIQINALDHGKASRPASPISPANPPGLDSPASPVRNNLIKIETSLRKSIKKKKNEKLSLS